MASRQAEVLLLLMALGSVCLASPVYYPEEASDGTNGALASSSVVLKENADVDKLGEQALIAEEDAVAGDSSSAVDSGEDGSSASDENTTEPVKKLLIRTFTDLNPKVAMELSNITMIIVNATDFEETKKLGEDSTTTTESIGEDEITTTMETTQEISTTESNTASTTTASTSTTSVTQSSATTTTTTTAGTTIVSHSSTVSPPNSTTTEVAAHNTTTVPAKLGKREKEEEEEKEIKEIEAEIEAEPVILTQSV